MPARKASKREAARYSFVPREFAKSPGTFGLSVVETAILAGLLSGARQRDRDQRHKIALKAGVRRINAEKLRRRDLTTAQAKITARNGYILSLEKQQREFRPAETIHFDLTASELLRTSGLANDTRNRRRVASALKRLLKPLNENKPAPLRNFRVLPSGKFRLYVSGEWIEPPYVKISLPLPTRSLVAINLFLFLRCTNREGSISLASLCEILGISTSLAAFVQRQSIRRALTAVNAVLIRGAPRVGSDEVEHRRIPWFYGMYVSAGGRVRFRRAHVPNDAEAKAFDEEEPAIDDAHLVEEPAE